MVDSSVPVRNPLPIWIGCRGFFLLICFVQMLQLPHAESIVIVFDRPNLLDVYLDGHRHPRRRY